MTLTQLLTRRCTLVRVTSADTVDEYNNPESEETSELTICNLQPAHAVGEQGQELFNVELSGFVVALPGTIAQPSGRDRLVEVEGYPDQVFEFIADPVPWYSSITRRVERYDGSVRTVR